MAASDEFPRGGYQWAEAIGGTASVILPSVPGVAHVITEVVAVAYLFSPTGPVTAQAAAVQIISLFAGLLFQPIFFGLAPTAAAGGVSPGSDSWTGSIATLPGDQITVTFTSNLGGGQNTEYLRIGWHDI